MATQPMSFGTVRLPFGCVPVRVVGEEVRDDVLVITLDADLTDVRSCDG